MTNTTLFASVRNRAILKQTALSTLSVTPALITILGAVAPAFAQQAQTAQADQAPVEEVVVTGTNIVRNGFQAPTPVSVISAEEFQNSGTPNIADYINTLPALASSATPQSTSGYATGNQEGINGLNLRALGVNRTLVLLNGERFIGSTNSGVVDISEFPQQLISRVDTVTGGASAVYGSDALAGVVNIILDTKFTGFKAEVSGGVTTYGDDRNWKVDMTYGTGFAGDKGHFIISGEATREDGVLVNTRPWNVSPGWQTMTNPAYSATCGCPNQLVLSNVGQSNATLGGIIASGPLAGIAFGPNGTPYNLVPGSLVAGGVMSGGGWNGDNYVRDKTGISLVPPQTRQNFYSRVSYDLNDNWEIFGDVLWSHSNAFSNIYSPFFTGSLTVSASNAYLPASVAAQAATLGVTSFAFGTFNGQLENSTFVDHRTLRFTTGANGKVDAFHTDWKVSAYFESGIALETAVRPNILNSTKYALAVNAVKGPNGAIVCASSLANPNNGCIPYNLFGDNVNSQAALNYLTGSPSTDNAFIENVESVNISGEPFSDWAGPISIATGITHRSEKADGIADPTITPTGSPWNGSTGLPTTGSYTITEGYVETVIPLAENQPWAKSLEFNGAIRATGYTSGTVATWKAGLEYAPIDDIRFRATESRDIREPNLMELYQGATFSTSPLTNPATGLPVTDETVSSGNTHLVPETATTTGLGVVVQPSFLPGFNASFDYYAIDISNGLEGLTAQQVLNLCNSGNAASCALITQGSFGTLTTEVQYGAVNLAAEHANGFDIEASYQMKLRDIVSNWEGGLSLRVLATHYLNDTIYPGIPGSIAYQNVSNIGTISGGPPHWRYTATLMYANDPLTVMLTMRGISAGVYNTTNIQCTTGCPVSTANNLTINNNQIGGATYFDLGVTYKIASGDHVQSEVFLNVRNLANSNPPVYAPTGAGWTYPDANASNYDTLGRVFRAGVRFKM